MNFPIFVIFNLFSVSLAKYQYEVINKQQCHPDYQARTGDILTVEYNTYHHNGTMFNTTEIYEPLKLVLGDGIVLPEWEEAFHGTCAGEQVMMVVTKEDRQYFYQATVDVITRVTNPAPISHHHFGILAHDHGRCPEAKTVKIGSMVTMSSVTRIPNLIYLKYSDERPQSNNPVKIGGRGVLGLKVSESVDTFRAGVDQMVEGWDLGIVDACEGETRKIIMSQAMAYGEAGVFRKIPSQVPIVMDVEIMKVENFDGIFTPSNSETRLDISKVDFFLGRLTTENTLTSSEEEERKYVSESSQEDTTLIDNITEDDDLTDIVPTSPTIDYDIDSYDYETYNETSSTLASQNVTIP